MGFIMRMLISLHLHVVFVDRRITVDRGAISIHQVRFVGSP